MQESTRLLTEAVHLLNSVVYLMNSESTHRCNKFFADVTSLSRRMCDRPKTWSNNDALELACIASEIPPTVAPDRVLRVRVACYIASLKKRIADLETHKHFGDNPWWMVYNPFPNGKKPVVRHDSFLAAQQECQRVANLTDQKCHVLEKVATCEPAQKPAPEKPRLYDCDCWQYEPGNRGVLSNNWVHYEIMPNGGKISYNPRLNEQFCAYCGAGLMYGLDDV